MRVNKVSPNTIFAYGGAVRQFGTWLMEHDRRATVADIEPSAHRALDRIHPRNGQAGDRAQPLAWLAEVVELVRDPGRRLPLADESLVPPRLAKLMPRVPTIETSGSTRAPPRARTPPT